MGDPSITFWIISQIFLALFALIQIYCNKERDKEIEKLKDDVHLLKDGFKDHWVLIKKLLEKEEKDKTKEVEE